MITEEVKARMREICARYPDPRSGTLPCLHLAQEAEGYVTPDGIAAVSEVTGTKIDEVESVVTFYSMYDRAPTGKYAIKVCTSISCYLRGCDGLMEHFEQRLGIQRGQTTADGSFTLQGVECLAACGMAPVLQVNGEFVENVTTADADALIERLKRGEAVAAQPGAWNVLPSKTGASAQQTAAGSGSAQTGKAK
ncbi:MAG: NADH-ubiquinone oxidoreductase chain E [Ktedonobacterales bacterium]|jgi:NADH-quinone oxidoreductase E subunit|nr:MAG: NADH-ubiquinone oxidoreductase chain E [Ktedonobacterales bacterium]